MKFSIVKITDIYMHEGEYSASFLNNNLEPLLSTMQELFEKDENISLDTAIIQSIEILLNYFVSYSLRNHKDQSEKELLAAKERIKNSIIKYLFSYSV